MSVRKHGIEIVECPLREIIEPVQHSEDVPTSRKGQSSTRIFTVRGPVKEGG